MVRNLVSIVIIICLGQSISGCTVIGYFIGDYAAEAGTNVDKNKIYSLEPYTEINITFENGTIKYGRFKTATRDTLYLYNANPVPLKDISEISHIHKSETVKYVFIGVGAAIDLAIILNRLSNRFEGEK